MPVLYVAGYGRSGSTLLDMILGSSQTRFSAGEAVHILRELAVEGECACGVRLDLCPEWTPVLEHLGWRDPSSGRLRLPKSVSPGTLHQAILESTGRVTSIDSSKTSVRAGYTWLRDLLASGLDVRVVHLVRHPLSVMRSCAAGSNRSLADGGSAPPSRLRMLRGMVGWYFANLLVERAVRRAGASLVVIRFEDLTTDPVRVVGALLSGWGLDADATTSLLRSGDRIPSGHGVAGNRMRSARSGHRVSQAQVPDDVPALLRFLLRPRLKRYGYE